ncbi:MAG: proline dehydrogenase family protein, partial [Flavobacteriales bacterium]
MNRSEPLFSDTRIAFASKSDNDLRRAYWLFRMIGFNWLVRISPPFVNTAFRLNLPVKGIIRRTIFRHFCGGEDIDGCNRTIQELHRFGIGTILDYSVEGSESESDFDATHSEILATIKRAHGDTAIPFCVFKPTGIGRFALLEKKNSGRDFDATESAEYERFVHRLENICSTAHQFGVPVFVDAEESWIQDVIDSLVLEMMRRFNKQKAIVYNTVQLYRHDRLEYLRSLLESARSSGFKVGVKLVRGAYMEK